ncbi:hypothetical protein HMPREF0208_02471 [Citrobacter koseri]|nr:hypothetical protein HMPREF3207_02780 [Citrobacter koseri]KXB43719.1 hypothetical protein HMPREF0208_02471 [Citrobacter koseri]
MARFLLNIPYSHPWKEITMPLHGLTKTQQPGLKNRRQPKYFLCLL